MIGISIIINRYHYYLLLSQRYLSYQKQLLVEKLTFPRQINNLILEALSPLQHVSPTIQVFFTIYQRIFEIIGFESFLYDTNTNLLVSS